jgi:hypothetical protein
MRLWLIDLTITFALVVATEVAYRLGLARRAGYDDKLQSQLMTVQASTVGLLGLLLGFTLAMAESRFDARRRMVLGDAAAVASTYRRAELLPEPERSQSRELLRDYVDARRAYFRASREEAPAATARAQKIHVELWTRAVNVARVHPDWDVLGVYLEALDEMIYFETARDVAIESRLPRTITWLVLLAALAGVGVTGYAAGVMGRRAPISLYVLPILIALASAVIIDLDRTRAGVITTGDLPMERLQRVISRSPS